MIEEKIKTYLANGALFSAVNEVLDSIDTVKGVARGRLITLLSQLIDNDEILAILKNETIVKISEETGTKLKGYDPFYFIGKAYFPVYNPGGSGLLLLEVVNELTNEVLDFNLEKESRGDFLSVLSKLWKYLNDKIIAPNERNNSFAKENDITVLNWGHTYRVHTNPFENGKLKTENVVELSGKSLHFATVVATVSRITGRPIDPNLIFTGAFKSDLKSGQISHLKEKTEFIGRERPGVKKIVIPPINTFSILDRIYIRENEDLFHQVDGFKELLEVAFGVEERNIFELPVKLRHSLGASRIVSRYLGLMKLTLFERLAGEDYNEHQATFEVYYCKSIDDGVQTPLTVFPIKKINSFHPRTSGICQLMILDVPNNVVQIVNLIANDGNHRTIYAIGYGDNPSTVQIVASPTGRFREFVGKYLRLKSIWDRMEKIKLNSMSLNEIRDLGNESFE